MEFENTLDQWLSRLGKRYFTHKKPRTYLMCVKTVKMRWEAIMHQQTYRVSQKKNSYKIFGLEIMLFTFTCSQTLWSGLRSSFTKWGTAPAFTTACKTTMSASRWRAWSLVQKFYKSVFSGTPCTISKMMGTIVQAQLYTSNEICIYIIWRGLGGPKSRSRAKEFCSLLHSGRTQVATRLTKLSVLETTKNMRVHISSGNC